MSRTKSNTGGRRTHAATPGVDPALLQVEISFWQELIKLRGATASDESLERMEQALALAQSKLNSLLLTDRATRNTPQNSGENVYPIRPEDR